MIYNSKNSNKFSKSDLTDRPSGILILVFNHQKKVKFLLELWDRWPFITKMLGWWKCIIELIVYIDYTRMPTFILIEVICSKFKHFLTVSNVSHTVCDIQDTAIYLVRIQVVQCFETFSEFNPHDRKLFLENYMTMTKC